MGQDNQNVLKIAGKVKWIEILNIKEFIKPIYVKIVIQMNIAVNKVLTKQKTANCKI